MTALDLARLRLRQQSLDRPRFKTPSDVVSWFGAVQAQDYPAAKWSLGLRIPGATDASIEKTFDDGTILRTHVMRPTWHFVPPENIRWMQALTAGRVRARLAPYDRKLEITEKLRSRCTSLLEKALRGNRHLTRAELAQALARGRIEARGPRLGHIVMHAELDGLVCSGPRRGKEFTYALLEERAPRTKTIDRGEALARLALSYFESHGPAQVKDFAWWSGLTAKDAAAGLDSVKEQLERVIVDGKTYWLTPTRVRASPAKTPAAHLLSIYDEYVIAYKDRGALGGAMYIEKFLMMGNALTAVVTIDGQIVGTWKRTIGKGAVDVVVSPLRKLTRAESKAIDAAANRYGKFLGLPATTSSSAT